LPEIADGNTVLYFLICLAVAALPAGGASSEVAPVAVFTHYQTPPAQAVSASMEEEVDTIMAPLGFPLVWKSLDNVRGDEIAASLAVVTFRGNCDATALLATHRPGPLGITHVSDGVVIPFTDVDCDLIRNFLRKDLLSVDPQDREARLGRAVGRVLAHELFHIFAATQHHGSAGVGKGIFSERELTTPNFRFQASEFRVLRSSLKQARLLNKTIRPAASPATGKFIFQENGCAKCHGKSGQGTRAGPGLRLAGKAAVLAAKLTHEAIRMCARAKVDRTPAPPLDDDEIADIASFLGAR
jgi:cytochrome c553